MAQQSKQSQTQERATYLTLIGIFLGIFAAFSKREDDKRRPINFSGLDVAMLGLATFRAGRLAAYDRVTEPLRAPVTDTKPDEYGAGENVVAQAEGSGFRKAAGELVSCPTCVGTWAGAAMVYGLRIAPQPTRLFIAFMSATGLAELIDNASEAMSWTGKAQRKASAPE
ncbi:MAG: DUF1360 domain-containing protein [Chloroflexia bacterium]|jgi:hypothetical protein|nr:DUF1360 domain-containing protein [Chloroflexia bacterium]